MANTSRIFIAEAWLDDPKFECESKATLGLILNERISAAARHVICASSCAVGS